MGKEQEIMLVVDTETLGDVQRASSLRVYDLGLVARTRDGEVLEAQSWAIAEVFYTLAYEMQSAYYANKLPQYHEGMGYLGQWETCSFLQAKEQVASLIKEYGIKRIFAYNAGFDRGALNATTRALSNGFASHFLLYGVEWCDIMRPACEVLMNNRNYFKFAVENGFLTDKGNLKTSAEACYSFLTRNGGYVEHHTGLEDVLIESDILTALFKSGKKLDFSIKPNAWRIPQKKYKAWLNKE